MTWEDIILRFNLQVDDSTELSEDESLALLNQVYREVQNNRAWEWLKTSYSGTTSTSVPYIALPSDFKMLSPNFNGIGGYSFSNVGVPRWYTSLFTPENVGNESVVFVGTNYTPYRVIPFSSRRNYRDVSGYCYIDIPNSRLYFTKQPTVAESVEFDYIKRATDLTNETEPLFNDAYHEVLAYWMASKFDPIQLTAKDGTNYMAENMRQYQSILQQMQMEDAYIKLAQS